MFGLISFSGFVFIMCFLDWRIWSTLCVVCLLSRLKGIDLSFFLLSSFFVWEACVFHFYIVSSAFNSLLHPPAEVICRQFKVYSPYCESRQSGLRVQLAGDTRQQVWGTLKGFLTRIAGHPICLMPIFEWFGCTKSHALTGFARQFSAHSAPEATLYSVVQDQKLLKKHDVRPSCMPNKEVPRSSHYFGIKQLAYTTSTYN